MYWVPIPVDECALKCPPHTLCMRPEDFTEPIYCVHENFKLPKDLLTDPNTAQINFQMIGIGILVLLQLMTLGWLVLTAMRRFYRSASYTLPEAAAGDEGRPEQPSRGHVGIFYDVSLATSTV
jgi:hypothetical protein